MSRARRKRAYRNQRGVSRNATPMTNGLGDSSFSRKRAAYISSQTSGLRRYDVSELPPDSKLLRSSHRKGVPPP